MMDGEQTGNGKGMQAATIARWPNIPSQVIPAVLMHALQLPRAYREVFILAEIQQRSILDVAKILGTTPSKARKRLEEARRRMYDIVARLCGHAPKSGYSGKA